MPYYKVKKKKKALQDSITGFYFNKNFFQYSPFSTDDTEINVMASHKTLHDTALGRVIGLSDRMISIFLQDLMRTFNLQP